MGHLGRNGDISTFHRLIGFQIPHIIFMEYLLNCIKIHIRNSCFSITFSQKADKNGVLRLSLPFPRKIRMYHDVSCQSTSIFDRVLFPPFFSIFLFPPQDSSKVLTDKKIYFFEISYCTSRPYVIYFFQQKYYAPCMKVQPSGGALLEVNGFLCFPVSFTITKVNGDCLCPENRAFR